MNPRIIMTKNFEVLEEKCGQKIVNEFLARGVNNIRDLHFGLGMWVRNNLLTAHSNLYKSFILMGYESMDDMSSTFLKMFFVYLRKKQSVNSNFDSQDMPNIQDMPNTQDASTKKELGKIYEPQKFEDKIYKFWEDGGYFHANVNYNKPSYTVVIPPPNITGQLHIGHALNNTIQDVIIRHKRMSGYETLWMPGTDHASIATEAKIVEDMKREGLTKADIGRDEFLKRAWLWKKNYGGKITNQLKKLGSSLDWERERFTLDEGCSKAVNEVFVRLYEKGLIYRGERIINWCPQCMTSISEAEVEYEEKNGSFWHINYPLTDGTGYLEIATTRPETMLGDTAVAVNPNDERYKHLLGKTVTLPLMNKEIPIIADEYVEMDFGTGVVKITPAHDPNDFEVGVRHNLPMPNVMNDDATINELGGIYAGLSRYDARKKIIEDLDSLGLLVNIKDHVHNVGSCYRCSTTVEPRLSKQWFVKMESLAKPAIQAVKEGKTEFIPERFDKIYFNWMENIRDWCISRQLWWGHRIPAYYCECSEIVVSKEKVEFCPKCHKPLTQDDDTLDTWFSSALWPFSTLGWPEKTPELEYFFPTNTLVTAYDIIFFWVARMIFSGIEEMGEVPFKTVFIHGIVRDDQGRKMSKSLGNGVDPLQIIENYGADAIRFALISGSSPGSDIRFSMDKLLSARNFANKLWNATRFALMFMGIGDLKGGAPLPQRLNIEDKWIIGKLSTVAGEVNANLDKFDIGMAAQKIYDFIWDNLCDWYIEIIKSRKDDGCKKVLLYVLDKTLKLLHPFMPFITEEIWQTIPHVGQTIMTAPYPVCSPSFSFPETQREFEKVTGAIKAIRNRRSEMNVPPSKKTRIIISSDSEKTFRQSETLMLKLAYGSSIHYTDIAPEESVQIITDSAVIYIPLEEVLDKLKEMERLEKLKSECQKDINLGSGKLSNLGFTRKAPKDIIEQEKIKLKNAMIRMEKITQNIKELEI